MFTAVRMCYCCCVFKELKTVSKGILWLQFCLSPDYLHGREMTCTLVSLCFIVDTLCFFSTVHQFGSFWSVNNIISTSWKPSYNESSCGCGGRSRTYCIGDFYFINPLEGSSVKENQLPISLIFLHGGPCYNKLVVWAKTAVSPNRENYTDTSPGHIPHIIHSYEKSCNQAECN